MWRNCGSNSTLGCPPFSFRDDATCSIPRPHGVYPTRSHGMSADWRKLARVATVCRKGSRFPIADTTMSMEIKARDLLAAGWHEDRRLGSILKRARELQATGLAADGVFAALEVDYPKHAVLTGLRPAPAPLAEAVEAETPAETASVAASRARMLELLHVPVVRRGALMPDTCPAGQGIAAIP